MNAVLWSPDPHFINAAPARKHISYDNINEVTGGTNDQMIRKQRTPYINLTNAVNNQ